MKIPNHSSRDIAIRAAKNMRKSLQTHRTESPFQVGIPQLKAIRVLANILYAKTQIPNRYALSTPPVSLMKKISKLTRVEDKTAPTPRADSDKEYRYRQQKLTSPIKATPPSEATRKKYTEKLK